MPKLKLTIEQGATFRKVLTWKVGDPPEPVDLTGCSARMHIREDVESPDPLLVLSTENGRIHLGETEGTVALYLPPTVTSTITWSSAVYDLEVVLPASPEPDVRRLVHGTITVTSEVTRG